MAESRIIESGPIGGAAVVSSEGFSKSREIWPESSPTPKSVKDPIVIERVKIDPQELEAISASVISDAEAMVVSLRNTEGKMDVIVEKDFKGDRRKAFEESKEYRALWKTQRGSVMDWGTDIAGVELHVGRIPTWGSRARIIALGTDGKIRTWEEGQMGFKVEIQIVPEPLESPSSGRVGRETP